MATLGTTRGTDIPVIDGAPGDVRLTPETYTTLNTLVKTTKDFVMPDLVEMYGDQGITGFLQLTGAVNSGGTSDQVDWWEAGRRHRTINGTTGVAVGDQSPFTPTDATDSNGAAVGPNDVVMDSADGRRYIVIDVTGTPTTASALQLASLDGEAAAAANATARDFIVLGNLYGQIRI